METKELILNLTSEWAQFEAKNDLDTGFTSVGGLACRMAAQSTPEPRVSACQSQAGADSHRVSLAKLVELSRRKLRLSVEELASKADIDLVELLAIEKAEPVDPSPRTIYQLAPVLCIRAELLMELAGLVAPRTTGLAHSAVRFAARSEPMEALSSDEDAALSWFVEELSKS